MSPDDDWRENPEPDPPSLGPDVPEVDGPVVDEPVVDDPAGDASTEFATEGDSETVRLFWRLVVVLDIAFLAVSVGVMFVYFERNWEFGLGLVAFGIAVFGYGVVRYRRYQADDTPTADGTAVSDESDGDAGDPKG
ncbi:hypothetical protein BRC64_00135 [Halobacteriales archaeon QH_10_67_22]|nr:MAG: hypothetical protein BRC64_00135 [Halobacteriales archaeon QH_10_67_22]